MTEDKIKVMVKNTLWSLLNLPVLSPFSTGHARVSYGQTLLAWPSNCFLDLLPGKLSPHHSHLD